MCLDWLKNFKISRYEGWQIFSEFKGKLYPVLRPSNYIEAFSRETVPVNIWQSDKNNYELKCRLTTERYRTGFHLFPTRKEAELYMKRMRILHTEGKVVVKKVLFTKVVAKGGIGVVKPLRAIVVRERFVCS